MSHMCKSSGFMNGSPPSQFPPLAIFSPMLPIGLWVEGLAKTFHCLTIEAFSSAPVCPAGTICRLSPPHGANTKTQCSETRCMGYSETQGSSTEPWGFPASSLRPSVAQLTDCLSSLGMVGTLCNACRSWCHTRTNDFCLDAVMKSRDFGDT